VFFKSVNNSQSHHKTLALLCYQELVEQLQHFLKFYVLHGSATKFLRNGEKYYIYFTDNLLLFLIMKNLTVLVFWPLYSQV